MIAQSESSGATSPVAQLHDVGVVRDQQPALQALSWSIRDSEQWALLGPNGAGKSTLAEILCAYRRPSSGVAHVLGERLGRVDMRELRARIGYVSTRIERALPPRTTARDVVATGKYAMMLRWNESYTTEDWERVNALLTQMGVPTLGDRPFAALSDGERRRVLLARSLMPRPELLILDEPSAGLDLAAREQLIAALDGLETVDRPRAMVLIVHNVHDIPRGFSHCALLRGGQLMAAGSLAEVVTSEQLSACFDTPLRVHRVEGRLIACRPAEFSGTAQEGLGLSP